MPGGIHPPLSVIESWPKASADFQRRGWGIPITIIILFTITVCIVAARLWVRLVMQRNQGIDDFCIIAAMVDDLQKRH
jgi:hypothetical protein